MKWDPALATGIQVIDDQHREWIARLGAVSEAIQSCQGAGRISETLDFLLDYTRYHFAAEEKWMARSNYPGLADHRAKHRELTASLFELDRDFAEEGAHQPLAAAVYSLLTNWLALHIREIDQQFAEFLRQQTVTLSEDS